MKLPQLSLRELFWLVLVAAVGFAWLTDKLRQPALERRLLEIEALAESSIPNVSREFEIQGLLSDVDVSEIEGLIAKLAKNRILYMHRNKFGEVKVSLDHSSGIKFFYFNKINGHWRYTSSAAALPDEP